MIKTIVQVIVGIVGLFGVAFIGVLIQDVLKDNPKYKEEHRKKLYDWLIGARKDFPRFIIILSFLLLYPIICFAGEIRFAEDVSAEQRAKLTSEQETSIQQQLQAQRNDPALHAQRLEEAKQYEIRQAQRTPDQIAEDKFADENVVTNAQGNRELKIPVTGQRYIISGHSADWRPLSQTIDPKNGFDPIIS